MKVLLPIIWHPLTECIARAFEEEGHTVRVVDWRKYQKLGQRHKVEPFVIREAMEFRPDLAFCQFQAPGYITAALPKALRSIGCFSINWTGDVRSPLPDWYMDLAPHFSVTSFTNWTDVEEVRAAGHRSEFLQIGYDERVFNTDGAGERSGVVFLGNNYGGYKYAESESRRTMVQALADAFPDDFTVYGMSWEGVVPAKNCGGYLHEAWSANVLRSALVAVGWDHFHRPGFASDRLLRATACGCAVVNQHYDGIEQEHPWVRSAHSVDGMVSAVETLLMDREAAVNEGKMNAMNTLKQHRWNERVKQMTAWMP